MARSRFVLDPTRSQVWIDGSSSIHPIRATASGLEGWIELALDRGGEVSSRPAVEGAVRIEVARLRSGNPLIDAETRRRIDAGRHPYIEGTVTGSTRLDAERVGLTGDLAFRGETQAVNGELTVVVQNAELHLTGAQEFDVRAWGLNVPRLGLLRVHPTIQVHIEATAVGG